MHVYVHAYVCVHAHAHAHRHTHTSPSVHTRALALSRLEVNRNARAPVRTEQAACTTPTEVCSGHARPHNTHWKKERRTTAPWPGWVRWASGGAVWAGSEGSRASAQVAVSSARGAAAGASTTAGAAGVWTAANGSTAISSPVLPAGPTWSTECKRLLTSRRASMAELSACACDCKRCCTTALGASCCVHFLAARQFAFAQHPATHPRLCSRPGPRCHPLASSCSLLGGRRWQR